LCRRGEDPHRLWKALERFPRYDYETEYRDQALADVKRMAGMHTAEGVIGALSLRLLVASNEEVRALLNAELEGIFAAFPASTLWMLSVDARLLSRVSLTYIRFQQATTPDLRLGAEGDGFQRSLRAQSSTQGVNFADVVQPIFLSFAPAATGFAFAWPPHSLLLEYGAVVDLRRPRPATIGSLYESRALSPQAKDEKRSQWVNSIPKASLGSLLGWWIDRIDMSYTIATDPTRFTTAAGIHDASAQLGYMLTIERALDDIRTLGATPQSSSLMRLTIAFDLLDKLETLLGYGPRSARIDRSMASGRGFERLLNRAETLPAVHRTFESMPITIRSRFVDRASALFDDVYAETQEGVLRSRLKPTGVEVGTAELALLSWNKYVGKLVRSVRNSSHGLLDQLVSSQVRVAATHTGALPALLPDLVMMIGLAVIGDPGRLWARSFWSDTDA
jgi:hypothetical protein